MLVYFPSTIWDVVTAKENREDYFNQFAKRYWEPVKNFILSQGIPEHDAEDLTQEVFSTILQKDLLSRIYHRNGRFRSFIISIAKKIILKHKEKSSAKKRGGDRYRISLNEIENIPAREPEFDRTWMSNLLQIALARLERENSDHSEIIKLYINGNTFKDIADKKGTDEKKIRNMFDYAKRKLIENIREDISTYSLSQEEFQEELSLLKRFISQDLK